MLRADLPTHKKQAIIIENQLLWRLAASYVLEAANFKVTPIQQSSVMHCLNKNGKDIELVMLRVSNNSNISTLKNIMSTCQQHSIKLIFVVGRLKLATLSWLYLMHPEGLIVNDNIEQLISALEAIDHHSNYCAENLQDLVAEYHLLLQQSPKNLKQAIEQSVLFNGSSLQCDATLLDDAELTEEIGIHIAKQKTPEGAHKNSATLH